MSDTKENVPRGTLDTLGLVPMQHAAEVLSIDVKRLRGYVHRNGIADPIGSLETDEVYGWSCKELARRLSDHAADAP